MIAVTDGWQGARHIDSVTGAKAPPNKTIWKKEAPMLTLLRSDWFPTMLTGFALGGLAILFQQPALAAL